MKNTVIFGENNEQDLQLIIANLQQALLEKDKLIENLTHQLQLAKHLRFARKTEKHNPNQLCIFDEAELPTEPVDVEPTSEITVKEHVRVRKGRKPLPKDLPRIEVIVRCYEKAGFEFVKEVITPDGLANLMVLESNILYMRIT